MFNLKLIQASEDAHFEDFLSNNLAYKVNLSYLKQNKVYLLYRKNEALGGFVCGSNRPMKTIEVIASASIKEQCYQKFAGHKIAEISTLWLKKEYRKTWTSKFLWLCVARVTFWGDADYYLFSTRREGLRIAMNYPPHVYEFVRTPVKKDMGGEMSYFFLVERRRTMWSMFRGIYYFIFKPKRMLKKRTKNLEKFKINLEALD